MPQPSITEICLKITCLNFHSNFPGANELTCWCLGDLNEIFQPNFSKRCLGYLMWNCPRVIVIELHWWLVNIVIVWGNGFMLSGNIPLPEPVLTHFSVPIWLHWSQSFRNHAGFEEMCDTEHNGKSCHKMETCYVLLALCERNPPVMVDSSCTWPVI